MWNFPEDFYLTALEQAKKVTGLDATQNWRGQAKQSKTWPKSQIWHDESQDWVDVTMITSHIKRKIPCMFP